MATSMSIDLSFREDVLHAVAKVDMSKAPVDSFSFLLNIGLHIHKIICNGKAAKWEIIGERQRASFISFASEVCVSFSAPINNIELYYSGSIPTASWDDIALGKAKGAAGYNIISDKLRALSYHSVWYPEETSTKITENAVVLQGCSNYIVVNGIYDKKNDTWRYGGRNYPPYNIIAYRRNSVKLISNPYIDIYYLDDNNTEYVNRSAHYYKDVLEYYNGELYQKTNVPKCIMACLMPVLTEGGAYVEGNVLMVTTVLPKEEYELVQLNAHETAHYWCMGAPSNWEDWLNETFAEWSALMYALDRGNTKLFDFMLNRWDRLEIYKTFPPIKTEDGKRPDGVHHRGVILLYYVYLKHGKEAIRAILQTFVSLNTKNTDELLKYLHDKVDSTIPDMIRRGLILRDYALL